ncbi:MAG: peptide/nickel transport system permease protein [Actinomycetota bacterium]|jgi:peptide/nickel transport system permease protein|nr:peptide/nickel transport system permease protein [Actinomycetota bacterium]MEA2587281.1 peptide/nickel transport system permease protein [Actinomycetota bacterium]
MSDAAVPHGPLVVEPMAPGGVEAGVGGPAAELPMMTLWGDVWRRLRRNKLAILGSAIIIGLVLTAALAPLIAPYSPDAQNLSNFLAPPSLRHWFGTDNLGRDYFSRVIYGSRVSISIGIVATFISVTIGMTLGAVSGYFGGKIDAVVMRIADVFFSFPFIVGAIIIITALGPSFPRLLALFIAIGVLGWATVGRIFRSSVLQVRQADYVEAARALGAGHFRILTRHVVPNALAPVMVYSTIYTGLVILTEAALSFLGFGVASGTPAWGLMVAEGKTSLTSQPWLVLFPGLAIVLTVLGFIFLGDGLRDSLDPRLR